MKDYTEYSDVDFVMDNNFQEWVKHPTRESESFWGKFLNENPQKKMAVERARAMLRSMVFRNNMLPAEEEAMWEEISASMQEQKGKLVFMKPVNSIFTRKIAYGVVAVLTGCALIVALNYFKGGKTDQLVTTRYGEIKKLLLPDSSFITLNANSTIRYGDQWHGKNRREVWIDGEAFFTVKHTSRDQQFIVHTNATDIEVLGTEFNVMERDEKVTISLNSGRIKLTLAGNSKSAFMMPGDIVEVDAGSFHKSAGKAEDQSVWKENRLIFDDAPLSEILIRLRHIYGWEFTNLSDELSKERLTGELETKNEQELIKTLEKALRIEVSKEGNTVYISRR